MSKLFRHLSAINNTPLDCFKLYKTLVGLLNDFPVFPVFSPPVRYNIDTRKLNLPLPVPPSPSIKPSAAQNQ